MSVVLDTHVWLWWILGQSDLPAAQRRALDALAADEPPMLPAICLWETQMLHAKGRLELKLPFDRWLIEASRPAIVQLLRSVRDRRICRSCVGRGRSKARAVATIIRSARSP